MRMLSRYLLVNPSAVPLIAVALRRQRRSVGVELCIVSDLVGRSECRCPAAQGGQFVLPLPETTIFRPDITW